MREVRGARLTIVRCLMPGIPSTIWLSPLKRLPHKKTAPKGGFILLNAGR
jgi:hypothetical protein